MFSVVFPKKLTHNQVVPGSSPGGPTKEKPMRQHRFFLWHAWREVYPDSEAYREAQVGPLEDQAVTSKVATAFSFGVNIV
jgi:hypothetical protein